jgi:hypothetical protein
MAVTDEDTMDTEEVPISLEIAEFADPSTGNRLPSTNI